MQTEVSFHSTSFNVSEPKDYFINECCFGDDVARWLIQQLRARGLQTAAEPEQEDFGWYFTFHVLDAEHCFVIGFQPNDPASGDRWLGKLERKTGLLGGIFGRHKRGILPEAVSAIDEVLKHSPNIQQVEWHEPGSEY
jgi:hypothetical protein